MTASIHVLIVNDSVMATQLLRRVLNSDACFSPIGSVSDGSDALAYVRQHRPNVILMDIHMPRQGGVETTRQLLAEYNIPILIVTSTVKANMGLVFNALEQGALDAISLPKHPEFKTIQTLPLSRIQALSATFIDKVKTTALLQFRLEHSPPGEADSLSLGQVPQETLLESRRAKILVALGASAGGPVALAQVFKHIPVDCPASFVVVQHMDAEFVPGLISYLQQECPLKVQEAKEDEYPVQGHVYVASAKKQHLKLTLHKRFYYTKDPLTLHAPSINEFFISVAVAFGEYAVGVLLTGMGNDGAEGLQMIKLRHGYTIAQDEQSSAIYGMPRAAAQINAVRRVLPVGQIAEVLTHQINRLMPEHPLSGPLG